MNPAVNQLITAMHDEGVAPSVIHEVDDNTMYVGYCLPDTKSFDDKKWLVKRIKTETVSGTTGTIQTIKYLAGSRKFDQSWTGHETSQNYKFNEEF